MRGQRTAVIVLAAGKGNRFRTRDGKLFVLLKKQPLITYAFQALRRALPGATLFCAFNPESLGALSTILRKVKAHLVEGGTYRAESLFNVLAVIEPADFDYILIHDGARPFVTPVMVQRLFQGIKSADCCIPVLPVRCALKRVEKGKVETIERRDLYEVQTPQLFKARALLKAYAFCRRNKVSLKDIYDDAQLIEYCGGKIATVPADPLNIKITYPDDIVLAETIRKAYNKR
jgi:2-C-methyl-D-erythritol 4-phosphate cytidylyltransferase